MSTRTLVYDGPISPIGYSQYATKGDGVWWSRLFSTGIYSQNLTAGRWQKISDPSAFNEAVDLTNPSRKITVGSTNYFRNFDKVRLPK